MTSLPEGGRSRHDPDSLARQPARQPASSQGAAWQRLAEVAAPGEHDRSGPAWTCRLATRPNGPSSNLRAVPTGRGILGHLLPK